MSPSNIVFEIIIKPHYNMLFFIFQYFIYDSCAFFARSGKNLGTDGISLRAPIQTIVSPTKILPALSGSAFKAGG